ncbi:extracellular solute-binding protein [Candidatus Nucleicultrix amoebiphila]|jgi:sn-glycerol 3-phosphate transport system substrate-binding protein|uniref:Sugar ABC transporter substrate-binding protein n=1 Tax=Candidatus Nucleicultrix amoebiphila FS5 TaxID=1414854 RepID=A0A1W6N3Z2_9PROT|nr:ABC transporter substrate-binding protein [Candidatus Nucleicultrix amoebiphila]ARN84607.1 hypothetical protein GQ61_03960 [Candidatus Nucleicultrix amoebiphila FS5]
MKNFLHYLLIGCFLISLSACTKNSFEDTPQTTLKICTGFSGKIHEAFLLYLEAFNKSQTSVKAEVVDKGNYLDVFKTVIAEKDKPLEARPDLYHISEFASPTIIAHYQNSTSQGKKLIPVGEIIPALNDMQFFAGLEENYGLNGTLLGFPFNPSMGIMFVNQELLQKAYGPNYQWKYSTPMSWDELIAFTEKTLGILRTKEPGKKFYGFTFPWSAAYTYEYLTSMTNMPITTHENGFDDMYKARFILHRNPHIIDFFEKLRQWSKQDIYRYVSDFSNVAEEAFAQGDTLILMQGVGRLNDIQKEISKAKQKFDLSFAPLPYDRKAIESPYAPKIGGGAFWATNKSEGVRLFLDFVSTPENQVLWSKLSGYMPSTIKAHQILEERNFYQSNPAVKIALSQVIERPWSLLTHTRLGDYGDIRGKLFNGMLVQFLNSTQDAKEFLKSFDTNANEKLEVFALEKLKSNPENN